MQSALFSGHVTHHRFVPKPHSFKYRIQLFLLDLAELDDVFQDHWLYSIERSNLVSFKRRDFFGDPQTPLAEAVRDRVEQQLGRRPLGSIQLVTQLRTFGYLFNPVSFYLCRDEDGDMDAIVAEITNTPWRERHSYVLDAAGRSEFVFRFDKDFHVSPFFEMAQVYEWRFEVEPDRIGISMSNFRGSQTVFHAGLDVQRQPINKRSLASGIWRFPLQPLRMHLRIYWHAALLFLKRVPFITHPKKLPQNGEAKQS